MYDEDKDHKYEFLGKVDYSENLFSTPPTHSDNGSTAVDQEWGKKMDPSEGQELAEARKGRRAANPSRDECFLESVSSGWLNNDFHFSSLQDSGFHKNLQSTTVEV